MKRKIQAFFIILIALFVTSCNSNNSEEKDKSFLFITKNPKKTKYEIGDLLELEGLEVIKSSLDDNKCYKDVVVTGWTSEPNEGSKLLNLGTNTIYIEYDGMSISFEIDVTQKKQTESEPIIVEPEEPIVKSSKYFWGTWVRMDNGLEYEVLEHSVKQNKNSYNIISSDDDNLEVSELGSFKKESDGVMINGNIPYFRKGGTNLDYSLKVVGFSSASRAAATDSSYKKAVPKQGIIAKAQSTKYDYEIEGKSDKDGIINLKTYTVNDPQNVTIKDEDNNTIHIVTGLNIETSGDKMGTIALVEKDEYNLKITGTISDSQKDNGYLYGNNHKTYDMVLKITNISENKCPYSICTIKPEDSRMVLSSSSNLDALPISTLIAGASKSINIKVSFGDMTEPFINTGINITIRNSKASKEWEDYVPLTFYKKTIPITVAAKNPKDDNKAVLNGFVIYPDGNSQYFSVGHNSSKTLYVPTFGSSKRYKMVFSGAVATVSDNTEMGYSVAIGTDKPKSFDLKGSQSILAGYINYGEKNGEKNDTEETAYPADEDFVAYLIEDDIDYYTIIADKD